MTNVFNKSFFISGAMKNKMKKAVASILAPKLYKSINKELSGLSEDEQLLLLKYRASKKKENIINAVLNNKKQR